MIEFQKITSRDNPLIKQIHSLQTSSKNRQKDGLFVLEGLRICGDAVQNNISFRYFVVSESARQKYADRILRFSENADVCICIPDGLFLKIADTDSPQGVLAVATIPTIVTAPDAAGKYIGLENLNDPANLGAVARTAEALGVSGIFLTNGSCDPYSPKVLRASMGTLLRIPVFLCDDLIEEAHSFGLKTFACVVDQDALPIQRMTFSAGCMLMIGNEANGLSAVTKENADVRLTIPMRGNAESLNAAAAAAIAMWEMVR